MVSLQAARPMLEQDNKFGPVGHQQTPLSTFFNNYFPTANEQYYTPGPGRFDTRSELVLADSEQVFKDLGIVIRELARDNALWVNQSLMPIEVTDKIEFQVTVLRFDDVVTLEQTPAFGTSRTLDFFKDKTMVRNKRWGKALTFELDMMLRKEGQEIFTMQLSRIIRAFKDHASYIALNALFSYNKSDRNYFRTNAALANLVNMQHYQREIDEFGCFNKSLSRGFGVMYRYANAIENVNGIRPQFAIIPVEKQGLFKFGINKMNEHYRGGQNAVTQFMNGEEIASLQGISLRPSPCFPQHVFDNNEPVNLLSNIVTTGEYLVYEDLGRKFGKEYSTGKHAYIDCFSQSARGWRRIWVQEMNRHNGRWDSDGNLHYDHWQLIHGNVVQGQSFEELSDQYIYHDKITGSYKVCHYIGDMEKEHLSDEYLKSIVLTAHGRYPRLNELKSVINELKNFKDDDDGVVILKKMMDELTPFVKYLSQRLGGAKNPVFDLSRFSQTNLGRTYVEVLHFFRNCFNVYSPVAGQNVGVGGGDYDFNVNNGPAEFGFIQTNSAPSTQGDNDEDDFDFSAGVEGEEEDVPVTKEEFDRIIKLLYTDFLSRSNYITESTLDLQKKKKMDDIFAGIKLMYNNKPDDAYKCNSWFNLPLKVMATIVSDTVIESAELLTTIYKDGYYSAIFALKTVKEISEAYTKGLTEVLQYKDDKDAVKTTPQNLIETFGYLGKIHMDNNFMPILKKKYPSSPPVAPSSSSARGASRPPSSSASGARPPSSSRMGGPSSSRMGGPPPPTNIAEIETLLINTIEGYIHNIGEQNPFSGLSSSGGKPYRNDSKTTSKRRTSKKQGRMTSDDDYVQDDYIFMRPKSTMSINAERVFDKFQCPVERAVAFAVLSTPIHRDVFESMYDHDVIVPTWYILARPWQVDQMSGMCLAIGGKQTGTTYISEVHVTMSWKSVNQSGDLHATQWIGAVLNDPNRRAIIRTAFNDRYLQGANHDLWTDEELYQHATVNKFYSEDPKIPSFIVLSIAANSKWNEDIMSLKGKITQHDNLHYSSCNYYNVRHQFGLIHTDSISVVESYGQREAVNVIMFQGSQRQVGNVNGDVGETVENRGHHGHQQPDRCDVRMNGLRTMTDE